MKFRPYFILCFLLLIHSNSTTAQNQTTLLKKTPFILGETVTILSQQLNEDRTLNIYLPSSCHPDSLRTYPVIYLLDGSADEDFIHVAGLVHFGTFPWVNALPESILVGISNVDRRRDFTFPTTIEQDKKDYPTTGGSANFIRFLEKELLPFIENNYRTNDTTTIIGQSLGGLLATEVLIKKPELFTNYIIVNPSLWWDNESLLKLEPKLDSKAKAVYLTAGKDEEEGMVRSATELSDMLKRLKANEYTVFFKIFEGQHHGNILHLAVYDAFEQLFKTGKK
ncbi:MAG: alpha/beta hydrolase [Saprospiraceae bacterium]|nr:alpha/beta hydrolase [Saprospiraceae bacterium]